jgi:hypothetical protein
MGGGLDRSKGAGDTHDKERDLGHYIDLTDDGRPMGTVPLDNLPVTREAYNTQFRAGGGLRLGRARPRPPPRDHLGRWFR